jgi:hypothetical protein
MASKKLFSQSIKMRPDYQIVNTLGLRQLFRQHNTICIAGDPHRHCSTWFVVDKDRFFTWSERRSDIFIYTYVVEIAVTSIDTCVRIHAVERTRKP